MSEEPRVGHANATSETASGAGEQGDGLSARSRRSRAVILDAAAELLVDGGVGGFTVDAVSRRSGVAKTTIYRHWPTRESLVLDACARLDAEYDVPDTGTLGQDLRAFAGDIAGMLQEAEWASVLPSIVDAAERSSEFAALHAEIQRRHAAPVTVMLERAIARGELDAEPESTVVAASILGPLFYRRWFSREPLDEGFLDTVVRQAVGGVGARL
ncbi:TetR family transcriptional regulator [Brachybacterium endophyticum]|uniref:TetR family transcriptional regulator n=1 Tax=Brachybacterium endophyticum TaxID=2182385 RepID=A0A2U2RL32_9MICO|nr:TetR/AcrR family transcriptional regulator [Brachybacterium endophyticum]PWH06570.1 TetR family transcriptional regulator [Brachybacterium endophyticum]